MKYLVATHSFLVAIDVDDRWDIRGYDVLHRGHHYGIGFLEANDRHKILVKNKDTELIPLDPDTLSRVGPPIPLPGDTGAVHQIACARQGVYLANTDHNSLVFHDLARGDWVEYRFNRRRTDYNHVNSVFPCGDQVYALLHNRGRTMSELAVLDHTDPSRLRLLHTVSLWDHGCHNVYIEDGHILYNASTKGDFVVADAGAETVIHRLRFSGHTKGLSVTRNHIVIGFSDHAARSARFTTKGHLAVLDRRTRALITTIDLNVPELPHPIGNVNEIRCISERDYAHAHPERLSTDWSNTRLAKRNRLEFARKQVALSSSQLKRKILSWAR